MQERMTAVGYLCPRCGQGVLALRRRRDLEQGAGAAACSCGGSVLKSFPEGERVHLTVPCAACGGVHRSALPLERLAAGDTALSCPEKGQFCAFLGRRETVERRLTELETAAAKEKSAPAENQFTDSVIMYEVLSELRDIAARPDGITCGCGGRGVRIEVRRSSVDLICPVCGVRLRLGAATDRDLDDLCCRMRLRLPGRPAGEKEPPP